MRIHKTHCLNPTITLCFYCGKPKNEIVLLGAAYKEEAPMNMCLNKTPCEDCKKLAEQGIVLISVRDGEKGNDPYRTGKIIVIKDEAFERIFGKINSRYYFIEDAILNKLIKR